MPSFFTSYVTEALATSTDSTGKPLVKHYTPANIHFSLMAQMREDCERFCQDNARDLIAYSNFEQAGRDFWLTRQGLPGGFTDDHYPDVVAERLFWAAKKFPYSILFVGNDNLIHED